MTSIIRETGKQLRELWPLALGASLVSVVIGLAGAIAIAAYRDSSAVGEIAVIYIPVMVLPFAVATAAVPLPVMSLVRAVMTARPRWLLGCLGVALAPVQGLALITAGNFLFARDEPRSTIAGTVAVALRQRMETTVILTALAAGGLVLGLLAARRRSVRDAQLAG